MESFEYYFEEFNKEFSGWDFSHISERHAYEPLSWSYKSIVKSHIRNAKNILDMGTGGGEFLSSLAPFSNNQKISATENYLPNVEIAKKRLSTLGISVFTFDEEKEKLPFDNDSFDLIINRHESFNVEDLYNKLQKDGVFITQQVGGIDGYEINSSLKSPLSEYADHSLSKIMKEVSSTKFKVIEAKEEFPKMRFYDLGALIYYLKAIPWQVNNFSPSAFKEELNFIHKIISKKGYFDCSYHRFFIKLQK